MDLIKSSVSNWIKLISVILGILVFSLGEIALNDIENKTFRVKTDEQLLEEIQTENERKDFKNINLSIKNLETELEEYDHQLSSLESELTANKQTLDQLLENEKVNPDPETKKQISDYQKRFLELQKETDAVRKKRLDDDYMLQNEIKREEQFRKSIEEKYGSEIKEISTSNKTHQQAGILILQALLIVFLFLTGTVLFLKFRKSEYFYPVLGFNIAVYVMIIQAVYIHSPFRLHYYVFIGIGIAGCLALITWLIRNLAAISFRQSSSMIRKNLMSGKCPGCSSDISLKETVKGNYKGQKLKTFILVALILGALIGNSSGIIVFIDSMSESTPAGFLSAFAFILFPWIVLYVFINLLNPFGAKKIPDPEYFNNRICPVCGLVHLVNCDKCGQLRHNLLPFCNNCGAEKKVELL